MSKKKHVDLAFRSKGIDPGELFLRTLHGREALSEMFDFQIEVETTSGQPLELAQLDVLLQAPATLLFTARDQHPVHGVVRRVAAHPPTEGRPSLYTLTFVPRVSDLRYAIGSWVFQDASVPEIVRHVLHKAGFHDDRDFEFRLAGQYAKKEYVVQYRESDLAFVSRLMEHEGIYYFFEHHEKSSKLVIADTNRAMRGIDHHEILRYDTRGGLAVTYDSVTAFSVTQQTVARQVHVHDYNYRTPGVPLRAGAPADEQMGAGVQVFYGEHVKSPAESQHIARVRAQEVLATRRVWSGASPLWLMHSGCKFKLEGHTSPEVDDEYLVTAVQHDAEQSVTDGANAKGYSNTFTAIHHKTVFRPQRVTPKPKIQGVMHGTIDAAVDDGVTAPIDDQGRYRVLMPYDLGGQGGGRASRWIRMAQVSSGGGYGMHFPLHAGTEVLLAHLDGDPDRPIIVGSVPNPMTSSPVNAGNATQSAIRSRTGIVMYFDDAAIVTED